MHHNETPFFYYIDLLPNYKEGATDGTVIDKTIGHGFGKNPEEVFSKAIGEFLERYFLTLYRKKNFLRGSAKDLERKKISALNLNLLAGFSNEQKKINPKMRFNEDSVFYWEKVKRVLTGETVYAPAQTIYWNYSGDKMEPFLCEGNTNAAGYQQQVLRGGRD